MTKRPQPELTDDQIVVAAMEAGFMLSTAYGQKKKDMMPVTDFATLKAFTKLVRNKEPL